MRTVEGIEARVVETARLRTRVLFSGVEGGIPVLLLHGNLASATWWEETMLRLPPGYWGIAPDQRGYGGADPEAKIDATRGLGDLADDAVALLDHLGIARAHFVGSSLGGSVGWHLLARYPDRLRSAVLVAPGSPYGFGGTKDLEGTPCFPDYAGSGAGLVNPELVRRLASGDRSTDSPFSPRAALRALVFGPPFVPAREEDLLSATLSTHLGERDYPGDSVPSPHWPFVAPGRWGPNNALSPKYAVPVSEILGAEPKVPVLWIRGEKDLAVSDAAASDPGNLGRLGLLPGWPGPDVYPPQPMVGQTRRVLEQYAHAGGKVEEVVLPGSAHVPFLDNPEGFDRAVHAHLARAR
ncbi:MAG: alpha/beta hydrolase [Candidatus Acetothermia bacterium]|nr:alpha/beta hydrolase [Candidatus Acetothermia bacterium]